MRVSLSKSKNQQLLCVKLGRKERFDAKELELLNVGTVRGLLRPYAVQGSRHHILEYDVSSLTTLQFYLSCILDQEQFVALVKSCVHILLEMQRNFLHIERLIDDFERVFIHLTEKEIYFAYIPVVDWTQEFSPSSFFQRLIDQTNCNTYTFMLFAEQYRSFLRRPTAFSIREFEAFINAITVPDAQAVQSRSYNNAGNMPYIPQVEPAAVPVRVAADTPPAIENGTVLLGEAHTVLLGEPPSSETDIQCAVFRVKTEEQFSVSHTPFVIGREPGRADLIIPDNPTIGRAHAVISRKKDTFLLTDQGSINKSYLNGAVMETGREYPLEDGAQIRLSNEEFIFRLITDA